MTPIGKLTLSIIGLRLFGINGLLWGMVLGHILIDRSLVKSYLKNKLSEIDDNIRLMLPYKLYRIYNNLHDNCFGKLYGAILGLITFGWSGMVVFFVIGHNLFDSKTNPYGREFRYNMEDFWNRNFAKLTLGILGYTIQSHALIFSGIIIGFFIDEFRINGQMRRLINPKFWSKLNIIKLALHSSNAKDVSFIQSMAGLAAKVAKADGVVSENEIRTFKRIFYADKNPQVARIFNEAKHSVEGYHHYAKQLKLISAGNLDMQESIMENLFKIAIADGAINSDEEMLFDDIANIIGVPQGNYLLIKNRFIAKPKDEQITNYYEILGVFYNASDKEIKQRWKELINTYHPDKIQANGATPEEIAEATAKMAEINSAYEHIMKQRKAS